MFVYKMTFSKKELSILNENVCIPINLLGKVLWIGRNL